MSLRKRLVASAAVTAALATAAPTAIASAAPAFSSHAAPITHHQHSRLATRSWLFPGGVANPIWQYLYATCPIWFGTRNPATGCLPYPPFLP